MIHKRITSYLDSRYFFYSRQYGFRRGCNTAVCSTDLMDMIYREIDKGHIVTGLFLDLSKAFDLVNHDVLLKKLDACGIRGIPNDLIRSYLKNRHQFVTTSGGSSCKLPVIRGVPQGRCLGPLFFLIYVNDIKFLRLVGSTYLYADDRSIFYASPSITNNIAEAQLDIERLCAFFTSNGLSLNANKQQ